MINFPRSGGGLARFRPINGHSVGWVALARNRLPKWPISNWPEHLKDIFSLVLVNLHLDFSFFWSWELFYAISWMWCLSGICIFSESKLQMSYNELEFSIFLQTPTVEFRKDCKCPTNGTRSKFYFSNWWWKLNSSAGNCWFGSQINASLLLPVTMVFREAMNLRNVSKLNK